MIPPVQTAWSVVPWVRYDAEPPGGWPASTGATATVGGVVHDLVPQVPEAWLSAHRRLGVEIHDHDRGVTYRATVNPERPQELDYLETIARGHIDDNVMRRVPVERIRQEVLTHLAAQQRAASGEVIITAPGGLADGLPGPEELAAHMAQGWGRRQIATHYGANLRTVDGWIRRARQARPDIMPAPTQGKRTDKTATKAPTRKEAK